MAIESLKNKVIVITGASSGVGRSAALEFAQTGASLVLAARNLDSLNELAAECEELGAETLVVTTDVTDPKEMINLANAAKDWKGFVSIWINNAGVLAGGAFDATPIEVHTQVVQTNLFGYMNGVHAILPVFKEQNYGTIINNISIGGFLPVPYGAGYTASKFGLKGFSEAIKAELTPWPHIYVCDLFPAFLDTPGIQHAANYTGKVLRPTPPVYDPKLVAKAMVSVAISPKSNTFVGGIARLFQLSHAILPEITTKLTAVVMRNYFKIAADIPSTSGNLFNTVNYGMSTNGSSGISGNKKLRKAESYIAGAVAAGFIAGFLLFKKSK